MTGTPLGSQRLVEPERAGDHPIVAYFLVFRHLCCQADGQAIDIEHSDQLWREKLDRTRDQRRACVSKFASLSLYNDTVFTVHDSRTCCFDNLVKR
ncbi:uncharacterized protein MELLADRAFT_90264 [Melampsora larici-populina 98AG31]|uniref:Uncharacterized protein n=1 Tax=Melampsora larici-populina (strain 98AG31 / pathotype 3-4-7) TaxID=747676 RepID=F4RWB2_MELLP|nr:uncharacterized protein MELLADRAFT_90264 [Melampsora larici-populina 98AG31]EGG03254.1 hypothetical protein MELLADRAFT_90264 [Melampsora larici-populina 98AG31]